MKESKQFLLKQLKFLLANLQPKAHAKHTDIHTNSNKTKHNNNKNVLPSLFSGFKMHEIIIF